MTRALALVFIGLCSTSTTAQTATGTSGTTCTQSGNVLTCTSSTIVTLPSGVNLTSASGVTQFGLTGNSPTGPACTGLTANPSSVAAGGGTQVVLSVACPQGSYTYAWTGGGTASATGAATTDFPNLSVSNTSQLYQVTVCLASNANACNVYQTTVTLIASTPALSSCSVSPSSTSVTQGGTTTLTASCATGTGSGSGVQYVWTRNGTQVGTGQSYQLTANDTATVGVYTFAVAITNNAPSNASASSSVTVTASVPGATDYCPSVPIRTTIDASSPYARVISSDFVGTFSAGDNFIIKLNVTAADSTIGRQSVLMNFSDIGSNRGGRYVTISQSKCDFTSGAKWVSSYLNGTATPQNAASKSISLNDSGTPAQIRLTTGTWYINVQNVVGSCPSNVSCHVVVDWAN